MSKRDIVIRNPKGNEVFRQNGVDVPESWSDMAASIFASKYFYGKIGTPERETSIFQVIDRVVSTITSWGLEDGYFGSTEDSIEYSTKLRNLLLTQKTSFNSPIWFNLGTPKRQVSSACFILSVEDSMESIVKWWETEAFIFNAGSGSGINISPLRSCKESLSGGGKSSGPISFMRAADSLASTIKSGGRTRRSAKLIVMNDDHPDIEEFIACKIQSEDHLRLLFQNGMSNALDDDHLGVPFQSSNHTVSISDAFMGSVDAGSSWSTKFVNSPGICETFPAKQLFDKMLDAIYLTGDPGIQFSDTINNWNPVLASGRYLSSNPCGEHLHLNNTACNLAVLKLTAFYDDNGFDIDSFREAIDIMITAQDIVIDRSEFPTELIKKNSKKYRPLGLGYSDLGGLLMLKGESYGSEEGRMTAASIASLMTAQAYLTSTKLADKKGVFKAFDLNGVFVRDVIEKHTDVAHSLNSDSITQTACRIWSEIIEKGCNVRNSQVTLMAPNGTTGMVLDCATLGMEPEFSLIRYKTMVGGSVAKIVNPLMKEALENLNYRNSDEIIEKIIQGSPIEDSGISKQDLPVFDCALSINGGSRCLSPEDHIRMMAAIQPNISSGMSKTVNLPCDISRKEIGDLIFLAWRLGIKGLTFYRDGCKVYQPLTTGNKKIPVVECKPVRSKLPADREAICHKFRIGNEKGYVHYGKYEDGSLGELFITLQKEGSTIRGLLDAVGILTSLSIQYGVPLEVLVDKLTNSSYEPCGFTDNQEIPTATSILDYIFKDIKRRFTNGARTEPIRTGKLCPDCGNQMILSGHCFTCLGCGASSGCG